MARFQQKYPHLIQVGKKPPRWRNTRTGAILNRAQYDEEVRKHNAATKPQQNAAAQQQRAPLLPPKAAVATENIESAPALQHLQDNAPHLQEDTPTTGIPDAPPPPPDTPLFSGATSFVEDVAAAAKKGQNELVSRVIDGVCAGTMSFLGSFLPQGSVYRIFVLPKDMYADTIKPAGRILVRHSNLQIDKLSPDAEDVVEIITNGLVLMAGLAANFAAIRAYQEEQRAAGRFQAASGHAPQSSGPISNITDFGAASAARSQKQNAVAGQDGPGSAASAGGAGSSNRQQPERQSPPAVAALYAADALGRQRLGLAPDANFAAAFAGAGGG